MTYGHRRGRPGPYDRGTYPLAVSKAQAAAGTVLHAGRMRLMGWSLVSAAVDTLQNQGAVVAPAAGATIVTIINPSANDLLVTWTVGLIGPAAAADEDNFQLVNGVTAILTSDNLPAAGEYSQPGVVITVPAGGAVSVKAIGAGTAGVTYTAQLTLGVLAGGAIGQLLDAAQVVGVTSTGEDQLDTQWFGDEGVYVGTSIAVLATTGALSGVVYVCDEPAGLEEDEPSQPSSSPSQRSSQPARP